MTPKRYNPVPLDIDATHKRWAKSAAFVKAYDALADADAAGCELRITLAPIGKVTAKRANAR